MNIVVFGAGYVGLSTASCFAEMGNKVSCVDIDNNKIEKLSKGQIPLYEPGLEDFIKRNLKVGRLSFTTDSKKAIEEAEVIFCAVGTPPKKDYQPDTEQVEQVAKDVGKYMNGYKVFVIKSTVPIGTTKKCKAIIQKELSERNVDHEFDVAFNPEFLRQGEALNDTINPNRIILGIDNEEPVKLLSKLYYPILRTGKPLMFTDLCSAEVTKYAANAFLSTKISFINELAHLCEKTGGNIKDVAQGIGLDPRIGHQFLNAGIGYGGSCLKKDVQALIHHAKKHNHEFKLLQAVEDINERQKTVLIDKLLSNIPTLENKKIALWGLTFKPKTDDMRDAPSLQIIEQLKMHNADIHVYDPIQKDLPDVVHSANSLEAAKDADALLILTEWEEFKGVDLKKLKTAMKGNLILDGRNMYDQKAAKQEGFRYVGIGITQPQEFD
ncbi:UDP-glucose dehydrogenase family protein [Patescibacteria group bacterium]